LSSYDEWRDLFAPHGYSPCGVRRVMQLSLAGFRPPISRDLMQIRRKYVLEARLDPQPKTWWEACTDGYENRTRFSLAPRSPHSPCGQATFWDMEPLASSWGVHAAGLIEIEVDDALRRTGVASFLLGESLRQLQSQGVTLVEAQVDDEQTAAFALLVKLGFKQIDEGRILKKKLVAES
ncbi:MAG: GNAT family N-acetyltransferase, partial [Pirellulaceae bacterium]|nr:GNAT family N-acetyltransferase [Pirellulaceae bacterium]